MLGGAGLGVASAATVAGARPARSQNISTTTVAFRVVDFGAVGDGTADDAPAIQAALDAAVSSGGGRVHLPVGEYKLQNRLTLGDGIDLVGDGPQSVLKPVFQASPVINRVIDNDWINGNHNIALRNFKIDRSGANVQHGILLNGVTNLLVDGIEVSGFPSTTSGCLSISAVGPASRLLTSSSRVVNCTFADTSNFGVQVGYVNGCVIANNNAHNAGREVFGVEPEIGSAASNVVITGNTITGAESVNGSVTGLIIATVSSGGTIAGVTITGNVLRHPSGLGTYNPGVLVLGGDAVNITANSIHGMPGSGIQIGNKAHPTSGVVISGNTVSDCGRSIGAPGIRLRNASHCTVTGNYVHGSGHTSSIAEEFGSNDNLIGVNSLRDATPVDSSAEGTAVFGNKFSDRSAATIAGAGYAMKRSEVVQDYTILSSDYLVAITDTASPREIALPPANATLAGTLFLLKDESGGAGANNITVTGAGADTIDGANSLMLKTDYASVRIYCTGTGWAVI